MGENKGFKILAIVALCVAVAGLSIAYAALDETLTIKTSGSVASSEDAWKITYTAGTCTVVTGASSLTAAGNIGVEATTVTTSGAVLGAPGDSVKCTFTAKNEGTIDAEISAVNLGTIASQADEYVKTNVTYSLKDVTATATDPAIGQTLAVGETRNYEITLSLNSTANNLPATGATITDITSTITYSQA